jgi:hypothetical protein
MNLLCKLFGHRGAGIHSTPYEDSYYIYSSVFEFCNRCRESRHMGNIRTVIKEQPTEAKVSSGPPGPGGPGGETTPAPFPADQVP